MDEMEDAYIEGIEAELAGGSRYMHMMQAAYYRQYGLDPSEVVLVKQETVNGVTLYFFLPLSEVIE